MLAIILSLVSEFFKEFIDELVNFDDAHAQVIKSINVSLLFELLSQLILADLVDDLQLKLFDLGEQHADVGLVLNNARQHILVDAVFEGSALRHKDVVDLILVLLNHAQHPLDLVMVNEHVDAQLFPLQLVNSDLVVFDFLHVIRVQFIVLLGDLFLEAFRRAPQVINLTLSATEAHLDVAEVGYSVDFITHDLEVLKDGLEEALHLVELQTVKREDGIDWWRFNVQWHC